MPVTESDVRRASGLDKRFLRRVLDVLDDTQSNLDSLSNSMVKTVNDDIRNDQLQNPTQVGDELIEAVAGFFVTFSLITMEGSVAIAEIKANMAQKEVMPTLREAKLFNDARTLDTKIGNYADDVRKTFESRTYSDGKTFSNRITTLQEGSAKTVRNIIDNGVRNGESAKQIAKKIEQYVNPLPGTPKTKPYEEYRKRFGRPTSFTPKNVPAGTIQYNALRIARSETGYTYRKANQDFYQGKRYVKGFKWLLSNTHAKPDICDDYASRDWRADDNQPATHSNCMCDWIPILFSVSELIAKFGSKN